MRVAIIGFDGFLTENLLRAFFEEFFGERQTLKLFEFVYADKFLGAVRRKGFDLFVVFFNPTSKWSRSCAAVSRFGDFEVLGRLKVIHRTPVLVVHNGYAGYSADAIRQAGADAVLEMPFGSRDLRDALEACLASPAKE